MKRSISQFLAVAILTAGASLNAIAGSSPGEVDFGQLAKPGNGGDFVEINVSHNLAALAAQLVEKQQPEAAKLLRSVQLVHVNVVGVTDENRAELKKRIHEIRSRIEKQGWQSVVTARKQTGEDVGIYVKTGAQRPWKESPSPRSTERKGPFLSTLWATSDRTKSPLWAKP